MISAWQLTASIGLLVARFYSSGWPTQQLFATKIWFTVKYFISKKPLLIENFQQSVKTLK
jgi:hypothetical protein